MTRIFSVIRVNVRFSKCSETRRNSFFFPSRTTRQRHRRSKREVNKRRDLGSSDSLSRVLIRVCPRDAAR